MKNLLLIPIFSFMCSLLFAQTPFSLESFLLEKNLQTQKTDEGLHYTIDRQGNGPFPRKGEYAVIRFSANLLDGTVFDQSDIENPLVFQIGNKEVIKGLDLGILLMRKGSRFTFYMPPALAYGHQGVGTTVPPNSPIVYAAELTDILSFEQYDRFMRSAEEKEKQRFQENQSRQFEADLKILDLFAKANNIAPKRNPSGLSIAIVNPGNGEVAKTGQRVKVSYEGFLMTGEPVEKPAGPRTYEFILGAGAVLEGWEEGLRTFKPGTEGWLLIPSKLAYGPLEIKEEGIFVPANSPIAFKVKVLEIIR